MSRKALLEAQLDGLVGPTHNYAGLSPGNIASERHRGVLSNPKEAALQGLAKMRLVASLGVQQAVLPPHPRPSLSVLRSWGFSGRDEDVISAAAAQDGMLLRLASSSSAMWTANAATVAPGEDTDDQRLHMVVANLSTMAHRSLEPPVTQTVLERIFSSREHFAVHGPLLGAPALSDEGAANHTRLQTSRGVVHLFGWGRRAGFEHDPVGPQKFVARQSLEASQAVARWLGLAPTLTLFPRQSGRGIDAGGFHSDVLCVGAGSTLLLHTLAFHDHSKLVLELQARLGSELTVIVAEERELPVESAVRSYPFNSQLLPTPEGKHTLLAPMESQEDPRCKEFLERAVSESAGKIAAVRYIDLRQSMQNGGGPACLRLRVPLTEEQRQAIQARIFVDGPLLTELESWIQRHYRDRLSPSDLADPSLAREVMTALDELTRILKLGTLYDFQQS